MKSRVLKEVVVPIIHFILIFMAYISPFVFDIRLIILGGILYLLQKWYFHGCFLNIVQFGDNTTSVYCFYLEKLGFHPNKKLVVFIQGTVTPPAILIFAILYQLVFKHKVLISF